MKTALCLLALLALTAAGAAEDLLADLRAEVAAMTATATLTAGTSTLGDGGPRYQTNTVKLTGDEATYALGYKSFFPPNEGQNRAKLNDWSSGLGMTEPSVHGWYTNGFVDVSLKDAQRSCSTSDRCAQVRLAGEKGKVVAADFFFTLDNGTVRLRFMVLANRPELFLAVTATPQAPPARLALDFRCYPGGFQGPFDRRVHTAAREFRHGGPDNVQVTLDPKAEPWMVLADHYPGLTMRPMGPCTIAADPEGLQSAGAVIRGNYSVCPFYETAPGVTTALLALREFGPTTWQAARDEVAATTSEALAAARAALATLPQ
jgi:hypothetical protein